MNRIAIYGAGGMGREVRLLVERIAEKEGNLQFAGFIDDYVDAQPKAAEDQLDKIAIGISDGTIRQKLSERLNNRWPYASLIHPAVELHRSVKLGAGIIICAGVQLTVDITIGDFVILNLCSTIGHDVKIGNFSAIMPSVNISGNVTIGQRVLVGSGATILQGLTIGDDATIGAGAVVTRSVPAGVTVVGVPARKLER